MSPCTGPNKMTGEFAFPGMMKKENGYASGFRGFVGTLCEEGVSVACNFVHASGDALVAVDWTLPFQPHEHRHH